VGIQPGLVPYLGKVVDVRWFGWSNVHGVSGAGVDIDYWKVARRFTAEYAALTESTQRVINVSDE
jgi:hypothetical protein